MTIRIRRSVPIWKTRCERSSRRNDALGMPARPKNWSGNSATRRFRRGRSISEDKVGNCPFEPDHKRTTKRAPSFELFRFLQRLVNPVAPGAERSLRPEEIGLVLKKF